MKHQHGTIVRVHGQFYSAQDVCLPEHTQLCHCQNAWRNGPESYRGNYWNEHSPFSQSLRMSETCMVNHAITDILKVEVMTVIYR
jgi:hypothetical protein